MRITENIIYVVYPVVVSIFIMANCVSCRIKKHDKSYLEEKQCECRSSKQGQVMIIKWQRLLSEDETCPRCATTEEELDKALNILNQSLSVMNIHVTLEKESLSVKEFEKDPLRSNRIWINGIPLEDYIAGEAGQSQCCDVCSSNECRTIEVEGKTYEAIPSEIIVKAGLIAASQMIGSTENEEKAPCCDDDD